MDEMQILDAATATMTTDQLMIAIGLIDEQATISMDDRMIRASMIDTVERRHNLTEAMDVIYDDDFEGTYTDALRIALAAA